MNQIDKGLPGHDPDEIVEDRYLLFTLGEDLFTVPLLEVGEVIEPMTPQALPNTVEHFLGLINVRGQLYGVIDLCLKFKIVPSEAQKHRSYLLFKSEKGNFALLVDVVRAVIRLDPKQIDQQPHVLSQKATPYLAGVAKVNARLISILRLKELIDDEELLAYSRSSFAS